MTEDTIKIYFFFLKRVGHHWYSSYDLESYLQTGSVENYRSSHIYKTTNRKRMSTIVKHLQNAGVEIISSHKGYMFKPEDEKKYQPVFVKKESFIFSII